MMLKASRPALSNRKFVSDLPQSWPTPTLATIIVTPAPPLLNSGGSLEPADDHERHRRRVAMAA
jgi:hypothetical protein